MSINELSYGEILGNIWKPFGGALLLYISYLAGKSFGDVMIREKRAGFFLSLFFGIIATGFFAVYLGESYGTHVEDSDPLRGGGEVVEDFATTPKQRTQRGIEYFFILGIPAFVGLRAAYKEMPTQS